ncbi:hypothetical protein J2Z21_003884 [Streptomyces griseochromogenes]|uniref:Uncharacterized protein n=1 Tax=Streptomyces griseochromogenes TaxID=68214 RepID=A0ABS4LU46_9ACTN|nr:hypothetical protein [Streptomyces griseochromogenes]
MQIVALGRSRGRLMRLQQLLQPFGVVDGRGLPGVRLASPVDAGIHRDPVQPCRDGGLPPEGSSSSIGRDQGVLDRISGLLAIPQRPQRDRPEPIPMPPYQFTKGVRVACDVTGQESLV